MYNSSAVHIYKVVLAGGRFQSFLVGARVSIIPGALDLSSRWPTGENPAWESHSAPLDLIYNIQVGSPAIVV